jgi:hypothetical protein
LLLVLIISGNLAGAERTSAAEQAVYGARGTVSGREFDASTAGGPLRNLVGIQDKIRFTHRAVDVVEKHTSRFGYDAANAHIVTRLRAIAEGKIEATAIDRNFYSHELREFVRYRRLGWGSGVPGNRLLAENLWNNTHTATLEEYGLSGMAEQLYHPAALDLAHQQAEAEFQNAIKFNFK